MDENDENAPLIRHRKPNNDRNEEEDEPLHGCGGSWACDPWQPYHRFLVLIIMCFLSFGSYFCYDNPAAMQDIMERVLNINTSQFMQFYAWYSWPNVVLCFFGGFLIDRILGIRVGGIVFASFVTVGQILFALGAYLDIYWLMVAARFVFGIGGESLCVAQNTYAVSWFKGKELNMVFGLQLSFSRAGSTVNMNTMHPLYKAVQSRLGDTPKALGVALLIAGSFCVFSLICALAMAYYDKRAKRILHKEAGATGEKIQLRDVKDFPAEIWLLCLICVAYYVTVFPFIALGLMFFERKFGFSPAQANQVNSVVYIISAFASPVFGYMIDKLGKNVYWVTVGVLVTLGCHALLAFTFVSPWVAMVVMGFSYSVLASALWPMAALVVPEHQLGTAYGLMQSLQNLGLATVSLVSGKIVDSRGYLVLEVFFLVWLCVAFLGSVILYLVDAAKGGRLNASAWKRREREQLVAAFEQANDVDHQEADNAAVTINS